VSFKVLNNVISVVFLGNFNHRDFSVKRLQLFDIIDNADFENKDANIEVTDNYSYYNIRWSLLQIDNQRILLQINDPDSYKNEFVDLVFSILGLMGTSGVSAIGINNNYTVQMSSLENWHKIGDSLVPKARWADALATDSHLGMSDVSIKADKYHTEPVEGHLHVTLKPILHSEEDTSQQHSLTVRFNNHFDIPKDNTDFNLPRVIVEHHLIDLQPKCQEILERLITGSLV